MKRTLTIAWGLLAITSVVFASILPYPRPWWFFIGVSCALTLVAYAVLSTNEQLWSFQDDLLSWGLIGTAAVIIRMTAFIHVVYSGTDHRYFLMLIADPLPESGSTLYADAPLLLIELKSYVRFLGLQPESHRFVTPLVSSIFVFGIGAIILTTTRERKYAILGGIIATVYPLGLRTSAIVEAEHLVLIFVVMASSAYLLYLQHRTKGPGAAFLICIVALAFTHFIYSLVFAALIGLTTVFHTIEYNINREKTGVSIRDPVFLTLSGTIVIFSVFIFSAYAGTAFSVLTASVSQSEGIIEMFVPTGTAASTTGFGTPSARDQGLIQRLIPSVVGKFGSLALSATFAAIGGIISLIRRKYHSLVAISIASVVSTLLILLVGGPQYGVRLYYFIGIFIISLSPIGLIALSELNSTQAFRIAAVSLLIIYLIFAPVSGLANNIDPRFGGEALATTVDEYHQERAQDSFFFAYVQSEDDYSKKNYLCPTENQYWSGGKTKICYEERGSV